MLWLFFYNFILSFGDIYYINLINSSVINKKNILIYNYKIIKDYGDIIKIKGDYLDYYTTQYFLEFSYFISKVSEKKNINNYKLNKQYIRTNYTDDKFVSRDIIKNLHNIKNYTAPNVSVGFIKFFDDIGFSQIDLDNYRLLNNLTNITVNIEGYNGNNYNNETQTNIQLLSNLEQTNLHIYNTDGWILEWLLEFNSNNNKNKVISIDWGLNLNVMQDIFKIEGDYMQYVFKTEEEINKAIKNNNLFIASYDNQLISNNINDYNNVVWPAISDNIISVGSLSINNKTYNKLTKTGICSKIKCAIGNMLEPIFINSNIDIYNINYNNINIYNNNNNNNNCDDKLLDLDDYRIYPDIKILGYNNPTIINNNVINFDGYSTASITATTIFAVIIQECYINVNKSFITKNFINDIYGIKIYCNNSFNSINKGFDVDKFIRCCKNI